MPQDSCLNTSADDTADIAMLARFSFGDSPALADMLLDLVLAGRKTATCWAARDGQLVQVGQHMIACDGDGRPRAVLETVALERCRFDAVDADFAAQESEGDGSLAHWREVHTAYFARNGGFEPSMELWCERFRVVEALT